MQVQIFAAQREVRGSTLVSEGGVDHYAHVLHQRKLLVVGG